MIVIVYATRYCIEYIYILYAYPGDAWILGYFTDTWSFSIQDTAYSKKQVSGIRILSADTCTFAQTRPRREKKVDYMYM